MKLQSLGMLCEVTGLSERVFLGMDARRVSELLVVARAWQAWHREQDRNEGIE